MGIQRSLLTGAMLVAVWAGSAFSYSWMGPWIHDTVYTGDSTQGDTVTYGTWPESGGHTLVWRAKFWTDGTDTPGVFAPEGGTSSWILQNSNGIAGKGGVPGAWKGWLGGLANTLTAGNCAIPTWKDGALGAYTMCHDDIGGLDWDPFVQPQIEVEKKYPEIHVTWGCIAGSANGISTDGTSKDVEWAKIRELVRRGDEIASHSWNHHSAADQWLWFAPKDTISRAEPDIPRWMTDLIVEPLSGDTSTPSGGTATWSNSLVSVQFRTGWDGRPMDQLDSLKKYPPVVTPKAGVIQLTIPATASYPGGKVYAKIDSADSINGFNKGKVAAVDPMWSDDSGHVIFGLKLFTVPGWFNRDAAQQDSNTTRSKTFIDDSVYNVIKTDAVNYPGGWGQFFSPIKTCEFYIYPYDAYSEKTHKALSDAGFISARGGGKSGKPTFCDFYHPYRLDYDAFYLCNGDTTALFGGKGLKSNPNQLLSINGLVTKIMSSHGYMMRELHAVLLGFDGRWDLVNNQDSGGYWGGIPADLYDAHLAWLTRLIDSDSLSVLTATEAVKYRITANGCSNATLTQQADASHYRLQVTTSPLLDTRYQDEISVICKFPIKVTSLDVAYPTPDNLWGNHPRKLPRALSADSTAWSIQVNPYLSSGQADITLNVPWGGDTVISPVKTNAFSIATMKNIVYHNGIVRATVPAGKYSISLYSLSGRIVGVKKSGISDGKTSISVRLNTEGISKGFYLLKLNSTVGSIARRIVIE